MVNAPESGKYSHNVGSAMPEDADEWLTASTEISGSWWPDWQRWISKLAPQTVPAREPGSQKAPALEDAPGSYVRVMS